jgi:hypothetical protein
MQLTKDDRLTIYITLDAEVNKLHRALTKAQNTERATNYATPVATRELLAVRERQARAAYQAAAKVAAEYFDTYLMND